MNANRIFLVFSLTGLVALTLWLYNSPAQATATYQTNDKDKTILVTCTNTSVELTVAECKAAFLKACPEGGIIIEAEGSSLDAQPLVLTARIQCKPSEVI